MYHVGRPGEDGFTERILAAWGVDGHNSHTNICSSGAREGYQLWMGLDRPRPDHANAKVILLISAHLESGQYFNPHAQRVIDGKASGAKLIVFDTRLSNTATHADVFIAPYPGSEAAILLSIANYLIQHNLYNREFVRRWWNWEEYLEQRSEVRDQRSETRSEVSTGSGSDRVSFEDFECALKELYAEYTFEFAAKESGVDAKTIEEIAKIVATAGTKISRHHLRRVASGARHRRAGARPLFFFNTFSGGGAHARRAVCTTCNKD